MSKTLLLGAVAAAMLAGCTQNIQPTDMDRGIIGAAAGAVVADIAGKPVAKGAAIGAAGGVLCDDVRLCQ